MEEGADQRGVGQFGQWGGILLRLDSVGSCTTISVYQNF